MYVSTNSAEATTLNDHAIPYRCVHCGHEAAARAYAFGRGSALTVYEIGLDGLDGLEARSATA